MSYQHTMTPLAESYDTAASEKKWQQHWLQAKTYAWDESETRENSYVIDTPPPTVSGVLHMGHVFSYTQADFIARFQRMRGKNVFYPMGFDDNGLPTERLVEKTKKIRAVDMSREDFIQQCLDVSEEARKEFRALFESIALSVDWAQEYHTISDASRRLSQLSFLDLVNKNHAYRELRPFYWDPVDQTAIAQAEIIDKEMASTQNIILFELVSHPEQREGSHGDSSAAPQNDKELVPVMTTRPELLPACVALMCHPADAAKYKGKVARTPLFNIEVPIIADEKVDKEKGTGLVMCCTFGDDTDIQWWQKYRKSHNLPTRVILNKYGKLDFSALRHCEEAEGRRGNPSASIPQDGLLRDARNDELFALLENKKVSNSDPKHLGARETIIALLKEKNLLTEQTPITHAVKCAERSGAPLEILPTYQWFVRVLDKKEALKKKSEECNWHPEWMEVRMQQWIDGLNQDWCISRQRYFGVPFPVWYETKPTAASQQPKAIYARAEDLPVNPLADVPYGYEKLEALEGLRYRARNIASGEEVILTPDADVMDTWATSSISPQLSAGALSDCPPRLRGGIKGGETATTSGMGIFGEHPDTTRNRELMPRAKEMRDAMTKAEWKIWEEILGAKKLGGIKFRRQQTIGNYIVDFVSMEKKLVIAIDGGQHNEEQKAYDDRRTEFLEQTGYRVLRFWNNDVMDNIEGVYTAILHATQLPPPTPPASGGGISDDRFSKLFPADLRPQAHEIIRTWAFYTLVKAYLHAGDDKNEKGKGLPWHNLMISGWCLAEDKTKMSKSKGNVVTPVALIEEKGTDAVRYWAATSRLGADTAFSPDLLKIGKKLVTKLWNATQFAAIHLNKMNAAPTTPATDAAITEILDQWILSRLAEVVTKATDAFAAYEYADALDATNQFFWADFCDNYLELIKKRVYNEDGSFTAAQQQSAVRALYYCLNTILKLYAPFIPHVTEELYSHIFAEEYATTKSLHARGTWPKAEDYPARTLDRSKPDYYGLGFEGLLVLEAVRKRKSDLKVSIKHPVDFLRISIAGDLEAKYHELYANLFEDVKGAGNIKILQISYNLPPGTSIQTPEIKLAEASDAA